VRYDAWDKRIQFRGTIVRVRDGHEGHKNYAGDTKDDLSGYRQMD